MIAAAGLACALDPVAFARVAGVEPDPWQSRVLRSTAPRLILCCSRQAGKSTATALLAVWTALFEPGSLVLLLSPTQRQSGELFRKALTIYRAVGAPVTSEAETALRLDLGNGSRILSLPGKEGTVRGYSGVRLLILDEAAWIDDDLYLAVRPMLAVSGGRIVLLSTPHGTRGPFYEAWQSPEAWERFHVPASECPRIPGAFLEEERRAMGPWHYAAEYLAEFNDAQTSVFSRSDVDAAFEEDVDLWAV